MKNISRILLASVLGLMILGLVMVFTSSNMYSQVRFNNLYFLFNNHVIKVLIAIILMFVCAFIPYENYKKYSKHMMLFVLMLLVITLFMPKYNGASRWIALGPIRFQPSELAKLVLIIHLSALMESKGDRIKDFTSGFVFPLIWVFAVCGLIVLQPNVSTSMIIMFMSFILMYIGGAKFKHLIGTVTITGIAGSVIMMILPHSRARILTFIDSLKNGGEVNLQVSQAKIALGSGGLMGIGLGQSRQSDLFLPESYGDFIFSVLGEELGMFGTVGTLLVYLLIFVLGLIIAAKAVDKFGSLLAFGLSMNIVLSAFINASVVTGLMPTTGITLPFISFGGTSIILFGMSVGILLNIANTYVKTTTVRSEETE